LDRRAAQADGGIIPDAGKRALHPIVPDEPDRMVACGSGRSITQTSAAGGGLVLTGFRAFLVKSNALALAIGVIIGAALGSVVNSLVKDVIMPPIGSSSAAWTSVSCGSS
jgi:hypothetical protein